MAEIRGKAWAKVNLGLQILDRRADGFHELRTVFQTISLADELTVRVGPGRGRVEIECSVPALANEGNLVVRAALAWLARAGQDLDVEIELEKRIPMGAGLGGGSSDAAAALSALQALHPEALDFASVFETAAELGSDVPFFLLGGRAAGLGRGTEVYALEDGPPLWFTLLAPEVEVSTKWAYEMLAASRSGSLTRDCKEDKIAVFCASVNAPLATSHASATLFTDNDFERPIFDRFPRLEACRDWLLQHGAREAFLTGSGAAVVGRFADEGAARKAAAERSAPAQTHVAHSVTRAQCLSQWRPAHR